MLGKKTERTGQPLRSIIPTGQSRHLKRLFLIISCRLQSKYKDHLESKWGDRKLKKSKRLNGGAN